MLMPRQHLLQRAYYDAAIIEKDDVQRNTIVSIHSTARPRHDVNFHKKNEPRSCDIALTLLLRANAHFIEENIEDASLLI